MSGPFPGYQAPGRWGSQSRTPQADASLAFLLVSSTLGPLIIGQPVAASCTGALCSGWQCSLFPCPPLQGSPSPCCICYLPPPPWFTAPTCFPPVCERNLGTWDMVFPEPWSGEQGGLASLQAPCFLPSPQRLSHIWRAQDTMFCLPLFLVLSCLHYRLVPVVV